MKLLFRPAGPNDVASLVELYDRHYRGGYSACVDRYGPATPQDFWWVQSEKSVTIVERDRTPAGLIIIGKSGRRALAEEVLLEAPDARNDDAARRQVHDFLTARFQQERQDVLTLRCDVSNAFALLLARQYGFRFANALLVVAGGEASGSVPDGYHIRRAGPPDARQIARVHEETLGIEISAKDLDSLWRQPESRVFIAEREKYPAGFAIARIRDGAGRWTVGVRDAHRRKGVGRVLLHHGLQFFHTKHAMPITTYWGTDAAAAGFVHAIGARTERTFLYLERPL